MNKTTIQNLYPLLLQGRLGTLYVAGVWRNFIAGDFDWAFEHVRKMAAVTGCDLVTTK